MEKKHQLVGAPAGPGKRKAPEPEGKPAGEEQEYDLEVGITGSSSTSASAASETRGEECQMVIVSSSPEYSKSGGLVGRCCKVNAKCQRFQPSTAAADPKLCSTCGHHQSFHHALPTPSLQQPKRRRTSAPIPASALVLDLTQGEPEPRAPTPSSTPAVNKASVLSPAPSPKASHVAPPSSSPSSSSYSFLPLQLLPAVTCRPPQLAHMRELKFEVRFAIEQLIALGDLKWYDLDVPILVQLRQHANSFEKAVALLRQKIKGWEQRTSTDAANSEELKGT